MSTTGAHLNASRWATSGQRNSHVSVAVKVSGREKDDFYPTPPEATRGLLQVERFDGAIWETGRPTLGGI